MDLTPYVDNLREQLAVAADAGGPDAAALAERLTAPLESAARLTLLNALSAAMGEITVELAPGSVDVRLRGLDPEFVVTLPPTTEPAAVPAPERRPPPATPEADDANTARINFRLPGHLKTRAEEAAGQEGLSVNAWLVRAVSAALNSTDGGPATPGPTRASDHGRYTGWVR
jgi:hypothetical protein